MEGLSDDGLRQACRSLWKEVFHDSEPFLDLYFSRRFTPDNTYAIQDAGRLLCAMQSLTYRVRYRGRLLRAGYVSGLATRADLRGRGLGTRLLTSVLRDLLRKGRQLSLLIPATGRLFDYYRRLGYVVCSYRVIKDQAGANSLSGSERFATAAGFSVRQMRFLNREIERRSSVVLHSRRDLVDIAAVAGMSGGGLVSIETDDDVLALGVCEMQDGACHLLDAFGEDEARKRLAGVLTDRMNKRGTKVFVHTYNSLKGQPYGMARVVNLKSLLNFYAAAHRELSVGFTVTDDGIISSNNGRYLIHDGRCTHILPDKEPHFAVSDAEKAYPVKTLAEVSSMLFEDEPLQMSLMLD